MKSRAHLLALIVVWLSIFAYGIYFSVYSIQRHRAFQTNASDLGQIDQAIWNTFQGRPLEFTRRTGEESIRLTDHVEPIFIPTALVFFLYDNVEALLILQSFVIALGALPIFWIAHRKLGAVMEGESAWHLELASLVFVAMYLLFPSLQAANLAEFHAVTFVPVLVLFAYYYGMLQKWGRFALFAFLLLMVKEEISLLVFTLGVYFALINFPFEFRNWRSLPARLLTYLRTAPRVPILFAALGVIWFILTFFVIIPHFNAQGASPYTCRYIISEECPQVARGLFLPARLTYLVQLFASSGFISILDPISLLLGSPLILANVISNFPAQYSGTFHYSAPVVPYFVLAAIGGTTWLLNRLSRRANAATTAPFSHRTTQLSNYRTLFVLAPVFLITLAFHLFAGYTPIAAAYSFPPITMHDEVFARFAAQIPTDAKLSTTAALHPHLSHRQYLYRYPVVDDADYILLDVNESDRGIPGDFRVAYNNLLSDGTFGVVDAADGYILLKRGAPAKNLPDAFYTPFRAPNAKPQYPAQIDFDGKIRFLGYDILTDQYGRGSLRTYWQRLQQLDQNYFLFPFIADADGNPKPDLNFPMTLLFWYPDAAWKKNEIVVGNTLPLDWGPSAHIGVGVSTNFDWSNESARLPITAVAPSTLHPSEDGIWLDLGPVIKSGEKYEMAK